MEKIKADHVKISLAVMNCHAFYRCGINTLEGSDLSKPSDQLFKAVPSATNLCLSIEIGLKIMNESFDECFEKTHRIFQLFCSLRDDLQKVILIMLNKVNSRSDEENINSIQKISNDFVELRYFGLNQQNTVEIDIGFVVLFAGVVHELALSMNPDTEEWILQLEGKDRDTDHKS